jgi:hypothetical protein
MANMFAKVRRKTMVGKATFVKADLEKFECGYCKTPMGDASVFYATRDKNDALKGVWCNKDHFDKSTP